MRELWLLRHAKSAWDVPGLADHDRDLARRGIEAAGRIGRAMAERGLLPDLVLCSTAKRAVRTLELASAHWPEHPPIRHLASLYLASPARLLQIVRRQSEAVRRLLLVGHDPGFHRLAVHLVDPTDRDLPGSGLIEKFPTGALCRLGFETETWTAIGPGRGRLFAFLKPRTLA